MRQGIARSLFGMLWRKLRISFAVALRCSGCSFDMVGCLGPDANGAEQRLPRAGCTGAALFETLLPSRDLSGILSLFGVCFGT